MFRIAILAIFLLPFGGVATSAQDQQQTNEEKVQSILNSPDGALNENGESIEASYNLDSLTVKIEQIGAGLVLTAERLKKKNNSWFAKKTSYSLKITDLQGVGNIDEYRFIFKDNSDGEPTTFKKSRKMPFSKEFKKDINNLYGVLLDNFKNGLKNTKEEFFKTVKAMDTFCENKFDAIKLAQE